MLHFLGGKSAMHFYGRVKKVVYLYKDLLCFLPGHAFGHSPAPLPPRPPDKSVVCRQTCGKLKPIFLFS